MQRLVFVLLQNLFKLFRFGGLILERSNPPTNQQPTHAITFETEEEEEKKPEPFLILDFYFVNDVSVSVSVFGFVWFIWC